MKHTCKQEPQKNTRQRIKTYVRSMAFLFVALATAFFASCSKDDLDEPVITDNSSAPDFKIVSHRDKGLETFKRKVVVFGVDIYAADGVEEKKLLHAAHVLAQYLDNDEDGTPDNAKVVEAMKKEKAFVVLWKNESDLNIDIPQGRAAQDLGNDETQPNFVKNGRKGTFDGAIEELWHIITNAGYAKAYPQVFGEEKGTEIANAMDKARGGYFEEVPDIYPEGAWYTYDDETCEYGGCQIAEYFYWGMSSILGAQEFRLSDIDNEWRLNTKAKVEQNDVDLFKILSNPDYKLPKKLPDGSYGK